MPRKYEIKDAKYLVEATMFEMDRLHEDAAKVEGITVETINMGKMYTIGYVEIANSELPVVVSVFFCKLNGFLVAFYEPTSQVVDHRMVDAWLSNFEAAKLRNKCDASNFAHCLGYIRQLSAD
jgi:hypothetical protein